MSTRPDLSDAGTAFAIGALVGIGMALLLRQDLDDDTAGIIRRLEAEGVRARLASRRQERELRRIVELAHRIDEARFR